MIAERDEMEEEAVVVVMPIIQATTATMAMAMTVGTEAYVETSDEKGTRAAAKSALPGAVSAVGLGSGIERCVTVLLPPG